MWHVSYGANIDGHLPMRIMLPFVTLVSSLMLFSPVAASASNIESAYTQLNLEKDCDWAEAASAEEGQMGGSAVCSGYKDYRVYFAEGDLRQFTAFGLVDDPMRFPNGFGEWNSINETIEWRLEDGRPFAVIHRWFLDNINSDTGSADPQKRGQVLVINTVADSNTPIGQRVSCPVGYVDALSNSNANELARQVADEFGRYFVCGKDRPKYFGVRGPLAGSPNDLGTN